MFAKLLLEEHLGLAVCLFPDEPLSAQCYVLMLARL